MYYIQENNEIKLYNNDLQMLRTTIGFMPEYQWLEIEETQRPIIDFQFADTAQYQELEAQKTKQKLQKTLENQIQEIDFKRIRALAEPSIKDPTTGETWLQYYTEQINELRLQIQNL